MKQASQFLVGIGSFQSAHKFITKNKLWAYVLLPGLINLLIIASVYILLKNVKVSQFYDITEFNIKYLNWLLKAFSIILEFIRVIIVVIIYLFVYKNLVLILMSPILSLLVDKVDEINTGKKFSFSLRQVALDFLRGLRITLRNIGIEVVFIVLFFFLTLVPLVGPAFPILLLFIQYYFIGFGMIDYTNERRRLTYHQRIEYCRRNKWLAIANGVVFTALLFLPLIGIMIAPAYATVAANISINRLES